MKKVSKTTVVFVNCGKDHPCFAEFIRYAGNPEISFVTPNSFHMFPPKGLLKTVWAEQNARRIRSFGVFSSIEKIPVR